MSDEASKPLSERVLRPSSLSDLPTAALAARASWRKRSVSSLSLAISPRRTLMATLLSMTLWRPA